MINPKRGMSERDAYKVLKNGKYGFLSTASKDGVPHGVAVNYVYVEEDHALYFHCARKGQKFDNMLENPSVELFVIGYEQVVPERFITHYDSAIVKGHASFIQNVEEKKDKILKICRKFAPDSLERRDSVIEKSIYAFTICKIDIDSISGKRNRDY